MTARRAMPGGRAVDGREVDVAVIGAGPAGSALSLFLARRDRSVLLFEKDRFPREKLCGEFLSGEARSVLERLGLLEEILALRPARIRRARLSAPGGEVAEIDLPTEALGLSRRKLDALLAAQAECAGVSLLEGATVMDVGRREATFAGRVVSDGDGAGSEAPPFRETRPGPGAPLVELDVRMPAGGTAVISAGLAVGAHGRRSSLDRRLARRYLRAPHPFVAFKRHHRLLDSSRGDETGAALDGVVEVHAFAGGYCGLSAIEDGEINVCLLARERWVRRLDGTRWPSLRAALAGANPLLARRLDGLEPSEPETHAIAAIPFSPKEPSGESLLYVGDAAGMIAPFAGDGQAMALEQAAMLAEMIAARPRCPGAGELAELRREWRRALRARYSRRLHLGRVIQRVLLGRRSAGLGIGAARLFPPLARFAVRATRGR